MIVDIFGSGLSYATYPQDFWGATDRERWTVASMYPGLPEEKKAAISVVLAIHEGEKAQCMDKGIPEEKIIDQKLYPLQEVIQKFGSIYFNNSIAYLIALAMLNGATEINFYGVDMEAAPNAEYLFERSCVAYWIGRAEGLGIKTRHALGFTKGTFLYGYEGNKLGNMLNTIFLHKENTKANIELWRGKDEAKFNQSCGILHALELADRILRG